MKGRKEGMKEENKQGKCGKTGRKERRKERTKAAIKKKNEESK
jgi:hypothetical protein